MPLPTSMPSLSQITTALTFLAITVAHVHVLQSVKKKSEQIPKLSNDSSEIVVKMFPGKAAMAKELCAFVARVAEQAISSRGVFHLALAGGSIVDILVGLVDHKDTVDFSKVTLSFVNHECVDPENESATLAKCKAKFAVDVGINSFVTPYPSPINGSDGSVEAQFYVKALKDAGIPHKNGYPVLDLILLNLGSDGQVGSCSPLGQAVNDCTSVVAASAKSGELASTTFTINTMNTARNIAVVVSGNHQVVKRAIIRPAEEPSGVFPAQLLESPILFVDCSEAAST